MSITGVRTSPRPASAERSFHHAPFTASAFVRAEASASAACWRTGSGLASAPVRLRAPNAPR